MACTTKTKPITGFSRTITLDTTDRTITTLLASAAPSAGTVSPAAKRITLTFNLAKAGQGTIIARIARDGTFVLTATDGERIFSGQPVELTLLQFASKMRAVSGTVEAYLEQFDEEV